MRRAFYLAGLLLMMALGNGCDLQSSASVMSPSSDFSRKDTMAHLPLKALNAFHQAMHANVYTRSSQAWKAQPRDSTIHREFLTDVRLFMQTSPPM